MCDLVQSSFCIQMINQEVKQQLLQLENRDVVKNWFKRIHGRELNTTRAREINAAAKQAAEFFRNAENASYSVRPLHTYYAIYSLSRALVLLLKKQGGENTLKEGHGLSTDNWLSILYGGKDDNNLKDIGKLRVKTRKGLFSELVNETDNYTTIHINSEGVNWGISYNIPNEGYIFTLDELISRIPDLQNDIKELGVDENFCRVNGLNYTEKDGFSCDIYGNNENVLEPYKGKGYQTLLKIPNVNLTCSSEQINSFVPQFLHKYVQKDFGAIPSLYIIKPFDEDIRFSEISIVFLMSYYLGMLVRYYPTHWISLIQGDNGDRYWPILNRAQNYVLQVFPELCIELINEKLKL